MKSMTFSSKVDAWIAGVIALAVVLVVIVPFVAGASAPGKAGVAIRFLPAIVMAVVLFGLALPVRYELGPQHLIVRSGAWLRWNIPYSSIHTITPTHNPLSSPALSLNRLSVEYGAGGEVLISPSNRDRFLEELVQRAPQLQKAGAGYKARSVL
jgi:membrane protein YdbS with pleckstrin-like domain